MEKGKIVRVGHGKQRRFLRVSIVRKKRHGNDPDAKPEANPYIRQDGDEWVVIQKGTGDILSRHATREKAEASFRAMEMAKHGGN
jgi:hypothetical protein